MLSDIGGCISTTTVSYCSTAVKIPFVLRATIITHQAGCSIALEQRCKNAYRSGTHDWTKAICTVFVGIFPLVFLLPVPGALYSYCWISCMIAPLCFLVDISLVGDF